MTPSVKRSLGAVIAGALTLGISCMAVPTAFAASTRDDSSFQVISSTSDTVGLPQESTDWVTPAKDPSLKDDAAVQILGINDLHGNLSSTGNANIGGKTYANAGSVARLGGMLDNAENYFKSQNTNGTTFRVEAGDMVGASPANSALLQDEPTMHSLAAMGFKIGTLGNHEFDEGLAEFNRILTGTAPAPNAFGEPIDSIVDAYPHSPSGIQIVESNILDKATHKPPFGWQPYTTRDVTTPAGQTVKVGFIGVDTSDLPVLTLKKNYDPYDIEPEAQALVNSSKALQAEGVKAIVVLAHDGVATSNGNTTGTMIDILKEVNELDPNNSIDIVIAGHSHMYADATVKTPNGTTKVVQAQSYGRAYDDVVGYVSPTTKDFVDSATVSHVYPTLSAKDAPNIPSDSKVQAIVDQADQIVDKVVAQPIGTVTPDKTVIGRDAKKSIVNGQEVGKFTPMENAVGDMVTDGQLWKANSLYKEDPSKNVKADFAITNTGGVRADLKVIDGKTTDNVTWGAAQACQPFGNILRVVSMTGQQIVDVLNQQFDKEGYTLQTSGFTYYVTDNTDKDGKLNPNQYASVFRVVDNATGKPIDPNKTYNVVINDFLAGGGDGFSVFKDAKLQSIVGQDTDAFIEYIQHNSPVAAPSGEGREIYMTNEEAAKFINGGQKDELTPEQAKQIEAQAAAEKAAAAKTAAKTAAKNAAAAKGAKKATVRAEDSSKLAKTGSDVELIVLASAVLAAAGLGLVTVRKRSAGVK